MKLPTEVMPEKSLKGVLFMTKSTISRKIAFAAALVLCMLLAGLLTTGALAGSISTSAIQDVCNRYGFKSGAYWTYDYNGVDKTKSALDAAATSGYRASGVPYGSGTYRSAYYSGSDTHYGEYIFQGGRQCFGFANFIGYQITGSVPTSSWTRYNSVAEVEQAGGLQVGDVIRAGGHSAMVYKVSGSTIYTVECWGGSKNKISVGGYFNGSAKTLKEIASRYSFSAVYRYGGSKPSQELTIKASEEKYPSEGGNLGKGKSFGLRGVYTASAGKITRVTSTIKDGSGNVCFSFSASPNSAKYDVKSTKGSNGKSLNDTFIFNKLQSGSYTMTVTVEAENGGKKVTKEVVRHFTIGGGSSSGGSSGGNSGSSGGSSSAGTPAEWGDWTKTRAGDRSGLQEETRHHWWAAKCKNCGTHNPYWGDNQKCLHCGSKLSSGNVSHVNVYTQDKGNLQTLNGRKDGRTIDGKNYWYCEIQYRYRKN